MKTARMRSGLLALLVLLAATAACTNTEQLNSGVGAVPVEITIVNPETRFERAFFDVIQVTVRPLNPDANEVLGTNPLWMLTTDEPSFEINLNASEGRYESPSQLTAGPYEVESINLQLLEFRQGVTVSADTCAEFITDYPVIDDSVQLVDFGEQVVVDVQVGAGSQLEMVIDGAALAIAFTNSWQCRQGPACGGPPPWPLWCLADPTSTGFFEGVFASQASNFVSFP